MFKVNSEDSRTTVGKGLVDKVVFFVNHTDLYMFE